MGTSNDWEKPMKSMYVSKEDYQKLLDEYKQVKSNLERHMELLDATERREEELTNALSEQTKMAKELERLLGEQTTICEGLEKHFEELQTQSGDWIKLSGLYLLASSVWAIEDNGSNCVVNNQITIKDYSAWNLANLITKARNTE